MKLGKIDGKIEDAWADVTMSFPEHLLNKYTDDELAIAKNWFTLGYYRAVKEIFTHGFPTS